MIVEKLNDSKIDLRERYVLNGKSTVTATIEQVVEPILWRGTEDVLQLTRGGLFSYINLGVSSIVSVS